MNINSTKNSIIALLVENNANVLSRIAMLFGKRGYNIDSLTVSATDDPAISRITISAKGDDRIIEQIILQTKKLVEVKAVEHVDEKDAILRELLLVKIATNDMQLSKIRDICDIYKGSIVDCSTNSVVCELTGKPGKIDGFLNLIEQYNILEMCRTGVTAIEHGDNIMICEDKESHRS